MKARFEFTLPDIIPRQEVDRFNILRGLLGRTEIIFDGGTIVRDASPVYLDLIDIAIFFNRILEEQGLHKLSLFYEPVAYAMRVEGSVEFARFGFEEENTYIQPNRLEVRDLNTLILDFQQFCLNKEQLLSGLCDDLYRYVEEEIFRDSS